MRASVSPPSRPGAEHARQRQQSFRARVRRAPTVLGALLLVSAGACGEASNVREQMLAHSALAEFCGPAHEAPRCAPEELLDFIVDASATNQVALLSALHVRAHSDVRDVLQEFLEYPDPAVRSAAAQSLTRVEQELSLKGSSQRSAALQR